MSLSSFGIFQIIICLLFPTLAIYISKKAKVKWMSPIVICYLVGIFFGNIYNGIDQEAARAVVNYSVPFAIPLLLFSTNIIAWVKHAKTTIISFALCLLVVFICSLGFALLFDSKISDVSHIAGMLVGVYSGGTPNMAAIKIALGASEASFLVLTAADILLGAVYLMFLITFAKPLFSKFLPSFDSGSKGKSNANPTVQPKSKADLKSILQLLFITIIIVAASVGISILLFNKISDITVILCLTTFAVILSFFPKIRKLPSSYEAGQYLLLIFSLGIGLMADFATLISSSPMILLMTTAVFLSSIILHLLLSRFFKIDVDTVIITSTAALYGPVFIGQVAEGIKNKELIFSGIATGLIGYAIGNYLGIFVAYLLEQFFF